MGNNAVSLLRCAAATTLLAVGCSQDAALVEAIPGNDAAAGSGGQDAGNDASSGETAGPAGTGGDAGTGGNAGSAGDAETDAGWGDDCEHAIPITPGQSASGVLFPVGAIGHYSVVLKAGDWARIWTEANPEKDIDKIDTVVSVLDADGNVIAEDDDAVPRKSPDSELFYRARSDMTACIVVDELLRWKGVPEPRPLAMTAYVLGVELLDHAALGANEDQEPNDGLTSAQTATFAADSTAYVYGQLGTESDIDMYSFTMPPGTGEAAISFAPKDGFGTESWQYYHSGSTLSPGPVQVTDVQGKVLFRIDPSKHQNLIEAPVPPIGDPPVPFQGVLQVPRVAGETLGTNDFYFFKVIATPNATQEKETKVAPGSNDTAATAEVLVPGGCRAWCEELMGCQVVHDNIYTFFGNIDSPSDVDYFKFISPGSALFLRCTARRAGSGLRVIVAVHDSTDAELQKETENDLADIIWWSGTVSEYSVSPPPFYLPFNYGGYPGMHPMDYDDPPSMPAVWVGSSGDFTLRLSGADQDPEVSSTFYRCEVAISDFSGACP
jgi:hypothetical protein